MTSPRSCVHPGGRFVVGIHKPAFTVKNLRANAYHQSLGLLENDSIVDNQVNFPTSDLDEPGADTIYEISNAFDFRGTTFINSAWADRKARHPDTIAIPDPGPCSFLRQASETITDKDIDPDHLLEMLPHPLLLALAQASTDPEEMMLLAHRSCNIIMDADGNPSGIGYKRVKGRIVPDIKDHELFEVIVNNPFLPDEYKDALVLKPGVQGQNEITAEYLNTGTGTHVFEYLRRNSYVPWGHFAANMANDAVRYSAQELSNEDMDGIRHLYYQRAFVRMAECLDIKLAAKNETLSIEALEDLRLTLIKKMKAAPEPLPDFDATLWGWNYGFGYAQSGHRLHASHQMIHQQNALIPRTIPTTCGSNMDPFSCGDQVTQFIHAYETGTGAPFFDAYLSAIRNNARTDGNPAGPSSLIILEDETTLLFVPKAQVCDFELQLITKSDTGNIFEADTQTRKNLDNGILRAVQILDKLGAKMVTSIEFSSRFESKKNGQHLLYAFIPRLPYAPPTFSEAQSRWICGLYPEDFAQACRTAAQHLIKGGNQ